ncbi:MurT ligase domain-containing protein [Collinsella provencensis]|uniref:MurT ligase domain-containing protein n=1 Tax=Collinsella provencensis TaxID=1937461 RepID=UPI001F2DAC43|nr:MurT ligase domain-containing protein [Collinsella provencensis]
MVGSSASSTPSTRGPRYYLAMATAKAASVALKALHRNAGQFPGALAEAIDPDFMAHIDKPEHVVFVSGTNGKTTTNNLLNDLLVDNGFELVDNRAGGNIANGIESTFIKNAGITGRQKLSTAVMELDELSSRLVFPHVTPDIMLVTNLYRDSFSRNANPDFIFSVMSEKIPASTKLVLNADDLISCRMAPQCKERVYFALGPMPEDEKEAQGIACDLTACPECGGRLEYDYCHMRHLGRAHCTSCGFTNPEPQYVVTRIDREAHTFTVEERPRGGAEERLSALGAGTDGEGQPRSYTYHFGTYSLTNIYNLLAALVVARELGVSPEAIAASFERGINVTAARYSEREVGEYRLIALASKGENSTATSVALDTIRREQGDKILMLMLADAHKAENPVQTEYIGWYYQSDFEYLTDPTFKQIVVQGATSEDLLLRLRLAGVDMDKLVMVATPTEAADAVDLTLTHDVYWAYDIFNGGDVESSRNRLIERIEAGELAPREVKNLAKVDAEAEPEDAAGAEDEGAAAADATGADVASAEDATGADTASADAPQMNASQPVIEVLYPEYGNQAGDNGNVMYLRACLPNATFVETSHGSVPYFAEHTPDLIIMCNMTERQQEAVIEQLRPYRDRLAQLIDEGVYMLFTGNAAEVLGKGIRDAKTGAVEGLDLLDITTERTMRRRYLTVNVGAFAPEPGSDPMEVVGFKIQFTQVFAGGIDGAFMENSVGWGLNEKVSSEGVRKNNLLATWMIGPVLPLNPDFTRWLLKNATGHEVPLAFEQEARAAYNKRVQELKTPGMHLAH